MQVAKEFITELVKEVVNSDPLERYQLIGIWAERLESRDNQNRSVNGKAVPILLPAMAEAKA